MPQDYTPKNDFDYWFLWIMFNYFIDKDNSITWYKRLKKIYQKTKTKIGVSKLSKIIQMKGKVLERYLKIHKYCVRNSLLQSQTWIKIKINRKKKKRMNQKSNKSKK